MDSSGTPPPNVNPSVWRRLLPKFLQIAVTGLSLLALAVSYIKWDSRRLQREIARNIQPGGEGKGFRGLASPVVADDSNFCAIPCLKDCAGGTGNEEREAQTKMRVQDFFERLKKVTADIKISAICEDPKTTLPRWEHHLRATIPTALRDSLPTGASGSAFIIAATHALIPELKEILEATERTNAQWTPALRIRKFKGPIQFAENRQPNISLGLAKLLGALAGVYLEADSPDTAALCIKAIVRIAEANLNEPLQISCLVGLSALSTAQAPLRMALSRAATPINRIEEVLARLQKIHLVESYARASLGEAAIGLEFVDSLDFPQLRKVLEDQPNTIPSISHPVLFAFSGVLMKNLALRTLLGQVAPQAPLSEGNMPTHIQRISEWQNQKHSPLQELAEKLFPVQTARLSLSRTVATAEAQLRLARLACAIEIHRKTNHRLPETLAQLPHLILAENEDPLAARPMRYHAVEPKSPNSAFRLWSVGLDFQDDNGEIEQTKSPPAPNTRGDIIWNSPARQN